MMLSATVAPFAALLMAAAASSSSAAVEAMPFPDLSEAFSLTINLTAGGTPYGIEHMWRDLPHRRSNVIFDLAGRNPNGQLLVGDSRSTAPSSPAWMAEYYQDKAGSKQWLCRNETIKSMSWSKFWDFSKARFIGTATVEGQNCNQWSQKSIAGGTVTMSLTAAGNIPVTLQKTGTKPFLFFFHNVKMTAPPLSAFVVPPGTTCTSGPADDERRQAAEQQQSAQTADDALLPRFSAHPW